MNMDEAREDLGLLEEAVLAGEGTWADDQELYDLLLNVFDAGSDEYALATKLRNILGRDPEVRSRRRAAPQIARDAAEAEARRVRQVIESNKRKLSEDERVCCPRCGQLMVVRENSDASTPQHRRYFWGCSQFARQGGCRGTRELTRAQLGRIVPGF